MSPFLEIGANAGHSSYMLCNDFGADGCAMDLSADALRHGTALMDLWNLRKAPLRIAGDALRLPFLDGSFRAVFAFQMLSQFQDIEAVFLEVKRVLAPGGVFVFAEEPMKRGLSLRLFRCPYPENMKRWERYLFDRGWLGFLVRDVIGAAQEEGFGIRQNHRFHLQDWKRLVSRHFPEATYKTFLPSRGWPERMVRTVADRVEGSGNGELAARLLGGTLAAVCKMDVTSPPAVRSIANSLRCPDCHSALRSGAGASLHCVDCGYDSAEEGGVYNLLSTDWKRELYPGARADIIDFTDPAHELKLGEGWHETEGVFGNKYRWMGGRATAELTAVSPGAARIRIRVHASEHFLRQQRRPELRVLANGELVGTWQVERPGLLTLEADLPQSPHFQIELAAEPVWTVPEDGRPLTLTVSYIRLIPRD